MMFTEGSEPDESGSYVVVIYDRHNEPVLRVLHYQADSRIGRNWIRIEIDEYGYSESHRVSADYITAYMKIPDIEITVVPEVVKLRVIGIEDE